MTEFLSFCALIGIAVVAFSIKRRREIDAFLAADLVDLNGSGEEDQGGIEPSVWGASTRGTPARGEKRIVGQAAVPANVVAIGTDYQAEEIATFRQKDALFDHVTQSFLKALRGKNSGRSFWVCRNFPDCRGIVSISS